MARKSSDDGSDLIFGLIELLIYSGLAIWVFRDKDKSKIKKHNATANDEPKHTVDLSKMTPSEKYRYRRKEAVVSFFIYFPLSAFILSGIPAICLLDSYDGKDSIDAILAIGSGIILALIAILFVLMEIACVVEFFKAKKEFRKAATQEERLKFKKSEVENEIYIVIFLVLTIVLAVGIIAKVCVGKLC